MLSHSASVPIVVVAVICPMYVKGEGMITIQVPITNDDNSLV